MADSTGLGAPDKVVVIDTPNKTLDKLAGEAEQPVVVEDQSAGDGDEQGAIRTIPDEEEETEVTSGVDDTNKEGGELEKETVTQPVVKEEDNEVDLDELEIETEDGTTRSVNDLLDERETLVKRVAEIEGDPFLKGLIDHYKVTGNIDAYYEAKGVDWDKKKDIDVLKIEFDQKNADLPDKTRELMWKRKLRNDYMIKDDLSSEELESEDYQIAQGLVERDARIARNGFKESQQKYKAPEKAVEVPKQTQQFDTAAFKKKLLQEKEVATFQKNKLLPLGVRDGTGKTLGFEPKDTDQIIEMMTDDKKFWNVFRDPTGKVNYTKLAKVYAYAQDIDFHEQSLVNLGKNLHLEGRLKDQKQIDDRLTRTKQAPPQTTSFSKGFLTEALKQRKK